eukprot:9482773-Pyramimonas_sp.AAC.1
MLADIFSCLPQVKVVDEAGKTISRSVICEVRGNNLFHGRCAHMRAGPNRTHIFSRWTNQTQESCVYSHDGPIRCRNHAHVSHQSAPLRCWVSKRQVSG